jgi:hypothetical protein
LVDYGIQQRRTYVKEVKNCRLAIRHFRHVKKRAKAKKAPTMMFVSLVETIETLLPYSYCLWSLPLAIFSSAACACFIAASSVMVINAFRSEALR